MEIIFNGIIFINNIFLILKMIELFTLPKDYINIFFDWPILFEKDGMIINLVDDCVWYSMVDTSKTELLYCRVDVKPKEKSIFQINESKILKTFSSDVTYYMDGNAIVYKSKDGKHKLTTLSDPTLKTIEIPEKLVFPLTFDVEKKEMENVFIEVFNIVNSNKDAADHIWFHIFDNKLTIKNTNVDEQHEYTFPVEVDANGIEYKSKFSMDLLIDCLKYYKVFDTIKISMGTNLPVKFEFNKDIITFKTVAFPRIDSNDD
ncbi:MAG: hypothetical protein WC877_01480 [Dehalococcoidales bacterium]